MQDCIFAHERRPSNQLSTVNDSRVSGRAFKGAIASERDSSFNKTEKMRPNVSLNWSSGRSAPTQIPIKRK